MLEHGRARPLAPVRRFISRTRVKFYDKGKDSQSPIGCEPPEVSLPLRALKNFMTTLVRLILKVPYLGALNLKF